jgi:hypothetical protein
MTVSDPEPTKTQAAAMERGMREIDELARRPPRGKAPNPEEKLDPLDDAASGSATDDSLKSGHAARLKLIEVGPKYFGGR